MDYAILKDGKPIIMFESKWSGADLNQVQASQLFRYFSAVAAGLMAFDVYVIFQGI